MFGKLLALPVRIVNVPLRSIEKIVAHCGGNEDIHTEDRLFSVPLEAIAKAIEEAADGELRDR